MPLLTVGVEEEVEARSVLAPVRRHLKIDLVSSVLGIYVPCLPLEGAVKDLLAPRAHLRSYRYFGTSVGRASQGTHVLRRFDQAACGPV